MSNTSFPGLLKGILWRSEDLYSSFGVTHLALSQDLLFLNLSTIIYTTEISDEDFHHIIFDEFKIRLV